MIMILNYENYKNRGKGVYEQGISLGFLGT